MCLRLERTLSRMRYFMEQRDERSAMACMDILFELIDLTTRPDLKKDLIQELQRIRQILSGANCPPAVSHAEACRFLEQIDACISTLLSPDPTLRGPQTLRDNDWLSTIRTRSKLPGGCCDFDLPSFHYWLGRPYEERKAQFEIWLRGMSPIEGAIECVLTILRSTVRIRHCQAKAGNFNLPAPNPINWALVQIAMSKDSPHIPEVNVNKFMLWIHFLDAQKQMKTPPSRDDFEFELGICGL